MTYPRKSLVSLADTPYYHVIARCVRRAWLWGVDEYAGKDYSHRKQWVLERLSVLSGIFAIDVCAFAIMSNHYHLVLHVDQQRAKSWSRDEVVERWTQLFSRPILVDRWQQGVCGAIEREIAEDIIERWRRQLYDVSWYMRCLNEHLARRANVEDGCTGRFWEGRFKSQALLDECGLLTAMAYVDLNPVRAGIARTPEDSDFTSIEQRIRSIRAESRLPMRARAEGAGSVHIPLLPFRDGYKDDRPHLPYRSLDYLELVEWSGRIVREDKRGAIDSYLPAIMQRLHIDPSAWRSAMQPAGNVFGRALGRLDRLRLHAELLKQSWIRGISAAARLYPKHV